MATQWRTSMSACRLAAQVLLTSQVVSAIIHSYEQDCGWIQKSPDLTTLELDNIEIALLQQCIFYNRTMTYEYQHTKLHEHIPVEKVMALNLRLSDIPPHGLIHVRLQHLLYFWIRVDEKARLLSAGGSVKMTWSDTRLAWNPKEFLQRREIELDEQVDMSSLWMPAVHLLGQPLDIFDAASALVHSMEPPVIDYTGNVTASFSFDVKLPTFFKYGAFPYDTQLACLEFEVRNKGHVSFPDSRFALDLMQDRAALWRTNSRWHAEDHDWEVKSLPVATSASSIVGFDACVSVMRRSGSARIGIYLPLMLACVLAVCAPLFGAYSVQAGMKVVALFLQFLCLNSFISWLAELPIGDDVPSVLRYYEFVMVLTTISLVTVLAVWSLSELQTKARPHPRLVELSLALNRVFLCSRKPAGSQASSRYEPTPDANANQPPPDSQHNDWRIIALGLSHFFFILYALIFVFGTLTLA